MQEMAESLKETADQLNYAAKKASEAAKEAGNTPEEIKAAQDAQQAAEKAAEQAEQMVDAATEQNKVTGVRLNNNKTGEEQTIDCAGVFIAIGHVPSTQIFQGQLQMDDAGYIIRTEGGRTNVPGVFVAGDCSDKVYRQAVTAAGMGCAAAIEAERFLASENQ